MMTDKRPLLLDLFSGAGGAAMGYHRAGFRVVGVDIAPQKNYPFQFVRMDALSFLLQYGKRFDVIHASPPCQFATWMHNPRRPELRNRHQNLIPQTRWLLQRLGKPYVIENVKGAARYMVNPLTLHGSMFGLNVFRERLFESSPAIYFLPAVPRRDFTPVPVNSSSMAGNRSSTIERSSCAMGITWKMSQREVRQAIPPAYTEFIGKQLLAAV